MALLGPVVPVAADFRLKKTPCREPSNEHLLNLVPNGLVVSEKITDTK